MKEDIYCVSAINGAVSNGKLILINMLFGIVLEYDLNDLTYTAIGCVKLPPDFDMVRVCAIIPHDDFLYLVLFDSEDILRFSKVTGEVSICGKKDKEIQKKPCNRSNAYLCGDVIWSIPWNLRADIFKYNIITGYIEKWKSMSEILGGELGNNKNNLVKSYVKDDKIIYLAIENTDIVIVIDTDTEKFVLCHVGEQYKLRDIEKMGCDVSLTLYDSNSFLRFKSDCSIEAISYESVEIDDGSKIWKVFMDNGRFVFVMANEPIVYLFDKKAGNLNTYDFSDGFCQIINKKRDYTKNLIYYNDYLYYVPLSMNCLVRINLNKLEGEKFSSEIRKNDVMEYYFDEYIKQENVFLIENKDFDVKDYVERVECYKSKMQIGE